MHDLLSFVPRPRTRNTPSDELRRLVESLVNNIQLFALHDRIAIVRGLAQCADEQRLRMQEEEAHGRVSPQ